MASVDENTARHVWDKFIRGYNNQQQKSVIHTTLNAIEGSRSSALSAFIGSIVILITLVVARPSFILTEPSCLYETPRIDPLKAVITFTLSAIVLFALDTYAHKGTHKVTS